MNNPSNAFEFIRLYPNLASDPLTGRVGEMYYNTTTNTIRICTSTAPTWGGLTGGANNALSNLTSPTAVNVNLLPGTGGLALGTTSFPWGDLQVSTASFQGGVIYIDSTNGGTVWTPNINIPQPIAYGTNYIGFTVPSMLAATTIYTLPPDGSSGQVLSTNGAGVLSWTSGSGGSPGGPTNSIQYNASGTLGGNSNFLIDTTDGLINLAGLALFILKGPITLADNQSTATTAFLYPGLTYPFAFIDYSIVRDGYYRCGTLKIANNGTTATSTDDFTETNVTGIVLTTIVDGSNNVNVQYTSTSTGFTGTMMYAMRAW